MERRQEAGLVTSGSQSLRAKVTLLSVLPEAWFLTRSPLSGLATRVLGQLSVVKQKNVNSWDIAGLSEVTAVTRFQSEHFLVEGETEELQAVL